MADINFGILDTQLPGRIAAIPQEARKQQSANMLQAMQMQGAMREGQMSQMKIDEMLAERKEIDTFAANLKARGYTQGSKAFFTELASSRNPTRMQQGFEGLRRLEEQDKFATIMGRTRPAAAPGAAAPSVAPEPGSFGADMAARREADPFASRTNMLPGAAAGVNALAGNAAEIEFKRQQRNDLLGMGTTQSIAAAKALDADIALLAKEPVYHTVSGVGLVNPRDRSVVVPSVEKPPAPPSMVAEYTFAKTPDGGGFRGSYQDFVTARAAAVRAPVQPVAPTITQIVDPSNPNQMITIDVRRYTGGGSGSAGVIGVSGKEPSAALRENKLEAGKTLLADEISNLRRSLDVLNTLEAIPSTERGVLSNLGSSMQASGTGQFLGKVTGTEAQTERDLISSSKLRLTNAIKQATGMSSQQLNSNVELQTMLKSLSDPSQAIETNTRNLDNIETAYVKPAPVSAPRAPQTPAAAAKLYSVSTPDGKTYDFNTPAKAAEFKKAAEIK